MLAFKVNLCFPDFPPSPVFQNNAFERVGDVFAAVDGIFEKIE
jgi:hypothetical protein